MKRLLLICCVALTIASPASAQDWTSLFNGKDLTGWEGHKDHWSVKDAALTGTSTKEKPVKQNTFLIWKDGKLENFELKLKFRMEGGNSGVQFRSKQQGKAEDYVVGGYQADIDGGGFIGILYEERGRGILVQRGKKVVIDAKGKKTEESLGDAKDLIKGYQPKEWNEYHIIAKGNHIQQFLNGKQTVDLLDHQADKRALEGILALQLHTGPAMVVQFKDIQLKRLPSGGVIEPGAK